MKQSLKCFPGRGPVCFFRAAFWALAAMALTAPAVADTSAFTITDDPALNTAVAQARSAFLAVKPYVTRLDVTLLVSNGDGTWRRGSYNPETIAYPASCVKLAYLASAMYWSRTHGHAYTYLDSSVRPMIEVSSNEQTGVVVDAITGAPNYSTSSQDAAFFTWYAKRQYTENFLSARGLLDNQTILHKTYPSNSGSSPTGAESVAINYRGGNRMQPRASASLMLEIVKGAIEPDATAYMRELLCHDRWGSDSELGFGLPPGTIYENKLGLAYDTLEDIAYVILPNGQEFILAAFSNGFVSPETNNPLPYDASLLGMFCETLIEHLGLDAGCPPKLKLDNDTSAATFSGPWSLATDQTVDYDMFGPNYRYISSDTTGSYSVTWTLNPPEEGLYEVCVWYPQKTSGTSVTFTVQHKNGSSAVAVDQRYSGGRWVRLGDYFFNAGQGTVTLTNRASTAGKTVLADAVKITRWPDSKPPAAGTDVIVDNDHGSPHFSMAGTWYSNGYRGYYGKSLRYATAGAAATATWTANLAAAGDYEVSVIYRAAPDRATSAKFTVQTANGPQIVFVDQTRNNLEWVSLGTFRFNAGAATVSLDAAGSSGGTRVIADAARFQASLASGGSAWIFYE